MVIILILPGGLGRKTGLHRRWVEEETVVQGMPLLKAEYPLNLVLVNPGFFFPTTG